MRVALIHTEPFPSPMAGTGFTINSAVGLAQAGVEVTAIFPDAGLSIEEAFRYYAIDPPPNLTVVLARSPHIRLGPLHYSRSRRFYDSALDVLQTIQTDAVIVRSLKLAAYLTARPLKSPLLYEMHDWYYDVREKWVGTEWMIPKKKYRQEMALQSLERNTMAKIGGAITLRRATAELVGQHYPDVPVVHASTGLRATLPLPEISDQPTAVYVGQLHPHKGIEQLIGAMTQTTVPRLLVVGGGDWLSHWQKMAAEKNVVDRCDFVGHVKGGEVPGYLAQGRVGVLPLLDCFFNRYVTSPLKILEYMAAGLPVVTADAPVTRELVEHESTGLLVPFGDETALARSIERICTDDALVNRFRQNIAARLPQMTWRQRGEILRDFIATL